MARTFRLLSALAVALAVGIAAPAPVLDARPLAAPAVDQTLQRAAMLDRFFAPDAKPLVQYRAYRRLTASTRGGRMSASLDAWTTLDPVNGFSFEVVSEQGSSLIRRNVLLAALEAEQKAQHASERDQAALTPANYEFLTANVVDSNLVRIGVHPKRKHVMLVDGSLFLDGDSADLVKIEGELSKRPSMWTRHVNIQREYQRIDGVHVPVAMSSTAEVLIVGASRFSMTYTYAEINGHRLP